MNTLPQHWHGERFKAIIRTANTSKMRYLLLIVTLVLLGGVAILTGQLVEGIFAAWPD